MMKKGMGLEHLKEKYAEIKIEYNLPSFEEMNKNFHIEKLAESETDILLREVRKFVGDKLVNYMRFVENLLNPVNVPMFVFSIVKLLGTEDKKKLSESYKKLAKNEIRFIELDLDFNEEKEAEFIKDSFEFWKTAKTDMLDILEKVNKNWDSKTELGSKGYFG